MSKYKEPEQIPVLREFPDNEMLRWQWRTPNEWIDKNTGQKTNYVAGFRDRKRAIDYGIMCGWV